MEQNTAAEIAKAKADAFKRIALAAIAGLTICMLVSTVAGCVGTLASRKRDPITAALMLCQDQPSTNISRNDAEVMFRAQTEAIERCRSKVFDFYGTDRHITAIPKEDKQQ